MKTGISKQFPSSFTIDTQLAVILQIFEWLQCLKRNTGHSGKTESESKDGNSRLWNGSVFFWLCSMIFFFFGKEAVKSFMGSGGEKKNKLELKWREVLSLRLKYFAKVLSSCEKMHRG